MKGKTIESKKGLDKKVEDKKILCPTEKERLILRLKKISNPN